MYNTKYGEKTRRQIAEELCIPEGTIIYYERTRTKEQIEQMYNAEVDLSVGIADRVYMTQDGALTLKLMSRVLNMPYTTLRRKAIQGSAVVVGYYNNKRYSGTKTKYMRKGTRTNPGKSYETKDGVLNQTEIARRLGCHLSYITYMVNRLGAEEFIKQYNQGKLRPSRSKYIYSGELLSERDLSIRLGASADWIGMMRRRHGLTHNDIQDMLDRGELKVKQYRAGIVIGDDTWSYADLSRFLGVKITSKTKIERVCAKYNYNGRLAFRDKAANAKWIVGDVWNYTCPVCGRHLMLTTEEITQHEHSESTCSLYEIADEEDTV